MKKILLLSLALGCCFPAFAQKETSIKIYQNTDRFQTVVNESWKNQITTIDVLNFNRLSVALSIKKWLSHEVELFLPEISKPVEHIKIPMNYEIKKDPRFEGTGSSFSLRYEIGKFLTKEQKQVRFAMAAGVNPYYLKIDYEPNVTTAYPSYNRTYGASFNIIPRFTFDITERLFLDLNIPLKLFDLQMNKTHIRNPAIPIRQQINEYLETKFFENAYTIRLGLAYSLGLRKFGGKQSR
jgi:hypothetical protein